MNDCLFRCGSNKASKLLPQRNGDDSLNANQSSKSRDDNVPVVASTTFEKYGSMVSVCCLLKTRLLVFSIDVSCVYILNLRI